MAPDNSQIAVAFYKHELDVDGLSIELSWAELAQTLTDAAASPCTSETCIGKKCPYKAHTAEEGAWSPVVIEGQRLNKNVRALTALVFDGDGVSEEQLRQIAARVQGLNYVIHTTHRNRPNAIFVRLIIHLSRPVISTEWPKFYPTSISYLGLDGIFDPTCKDLSRLYFLPTHPSDVPFLSDIGEGRPLDVDAVITAQGLESPLPEPAVDIAPDASTDNFSDIGKAVAMLKAYVQSRAHKPDALDREKGALIARLLAGKPLAKPGGNADPTPIEPPEDLPAGRGYAIMRVARICTGYLPTDVPDSIYFEIFRGSLDAMCFGRSSDRKEMEEHLLEKLRIGREGRLQFLAEAQARNTAAKAYQVALAEERIRERQAKAQANGGPPPEEDSATEEDEDDAEAWLNNLQTRADGKSLIPCGYNAYLILKHTPGTFRWNSVAMKMEVTGHFAKTDVNALHTDAANYLTKKWGLTLSSEEVYRQIMLIAYKNAFDPIRDYLRSLVWDGIDRINRNGGWLVTYAGVETTLDGYVKFIGRKWLISAVARGLDPGCKVDTVLIVEGEQGLRKSSLFEQLGGEWYADMTIVISDKDSKMIAARSWICEIPDLAALNKVSDINAIKAFFSTRADTFRPPFGRAVITSPRRNVFGGTTNDEDYLGDKTGNRRFLCVKSRQVDLAAVIRDRDQLWAQAVYLYDKHNECLDKLECGCWWLTREEAAIAARHADERVPESPQEAAIWEWWLDMPPEKRPKIVTHNQVARDALKITQDRIHGGITKIVGIALRKMGFEDGRKRDKQAGQHIRVWHATEILLKMEQSDGGKTKHGALNKLRSV